ncbi:hypothetical protein FOL47_009115 [Perkinsus chesapeaki]|uniref:Uncharacterized protein n=1 Tax=Perkinsus chesapeaki TaxID=330153 RepID=A0A7J6LAF9_PERCH|nr:hypothetical protein FOL47_009115 [Perkinsus chesapeaki]
MEVRAVPDKNGCLGFRKCFEMSCSPGKPQVPPDRNGQPSIPPASGSKESPSSQSTSSREAAKAELTMDVPRPPFVQKNPYVGYFLKHGRDREIEIPSSIKSPTNLSTAAVEAAMRFVSWMRSVPSGMPSSEMSRVHHRVHNRRQHAQTVAISRKRSSISRPRNVSYATAAKEIYAVDSYVNGRLPSDAVPPAFRSSLRFSHLTGY